MTNLFKPPTAIPFKTALLLVHDEANAVIDRRVLREAGLLNTRVLTSGVTAARLLVGLLPDDGGTRPEVVLCHKELGDMSAEDFITLIRLHPSLLFLPVLFITGYDTEIEKSRILAGGFNGIITRPYSQDDLRQALAAVAMEESDLEALRAARNYLDTGKFDRALASYEPLNARLNPEETFKLAMESLKEREWDKAIQAFNKTMKLSALKGESELGLATAWKGKGDQKLYRHYLERSGHTFAMAARWNKARSVYARMLIEDPLARSPFLSATERLMREGRYEEAAEAFAAGYDMSPQVEAQRCLAKSCLFAENSATALDGIATGLAATSAAHMVDDIRENVSSFLEEYQSRLQERRAQAANPGQERYGISLSDEDDGHDALPGQDKHADVDEDNMNMLMRLEDAKPGLLSGIPVLGDAIAVARMTWKLYNSGKK